MHEIFTSPFFRPTKALFFLLFTSLIAFTANAQNAGRFNNWYFGSNAGVSFASGSPVALTNGALLTTEGSASISDVNGNLLFYTDGVTVWNRNHVAMTNGIGLHGHASSTQSAIIVQKPGSANLYYIFTSDADAGANGIKYSEVNMTLSAGLGAVTANKNIALRTPSCEKITAVRHCNNTDLWIVSHDWNSNNFRTWLVTPAGVNTTPIVSAAGITATGVSQGTYGQLKVNPDGNKLVAAYYGLSTGGVNKMEAYDFNNSTGVVSNALTLASDVGLYGAEFSPNGRVVYGGTNQGLLLQFNLCAGSNAAIVASRYVVGNLGPFIGSMQLGPNNKVYVARNQTSLSVINNPNTPGVGCGYANGTISLSGRSSRMGLPNMASFYIRPDILPFTSSANCLDVAFTAPSVLTASNSCSGAASAIQSVQWNFGDAASGASNTSTVLNPSHTFSAVGTYSVRLVLNLGCYNDTLIQTVNVSGFTVNTSNTPASCGSSNGTATATPATAGVYTYLWSNGQQTSTATGLAAGNYSCTVTASSGCISTANVTVTSGGSMSVNVNASNAACFGANGSATASASGGTSPYSYAWSNGANGATVSLPSGNYSLTVSDAVGCTAIQNVSITQPMQLSAIVTVTSPLCNGSTGSASVAVSGGTAPYTYAWSTGSALTSINGLAAGNHSVTVTDSRGCIASASGSITIPTALTATLTTSNPLCFGGSNGSASVSVSGGVAPYTYLWSTGAVTTSVTNRPAGAISVTITDANGCSISRNATLTAPAQIQASVSVTPPACGQSNGSATASATGGSAPYTFVWSTGTFSNQLNGISAGNYSLTVTDNAGCSDTENFSISATLAPTVNLTVNQQVSCVGGSNGSIQTVVNGGTAPFNFSWNTGAVSSGLSGVQAGNYSLTVTDANGCTASANAVVNQPTALVVSGTVANATCGGSDGSIAAQVSGGTAPYGYSWNTSPAQVSATATGLSPGNYILTVTDANGCSATLNENVQSSGSISASAAVLNQVSCNGGNNGSAQVSVNGGTAPFIYTWSNGASAATAQNLSAGNYSVTVNDANGCVAAASINITEPNIFQVSITSSDINCNGSNNGTASAIGNGGTTPFSFAWSNGEITNSISGLQAGVYSVIATDAAGCVANDMITISEPAALSVSANATNVTCNGMANGEISLGITGGQAPYVVSWDDGSISLQRNGLSAGLYAYSLTDASGCFVDEDVEITEPALLEVTGVATNLNCFGSNDGSIDLQITGGREPYSIVWNSGQTLTTLENLDNGVYSATIQDAAGCQINYSATLTEPEIISLSSEVTPSSCITSDGTISVTASGGLAPYEYSIDGLPYQSSPNFISLIAGNHAVSIRDAAGCEREEIIAVPSPANLSLTVVQTTDVTCPGAYDGTAELQINGGTAPYMISWSSEEATLTASMLSAGTHYVTVTDAAGCDFTTTFEIGAPQPMLATASITDVRCFGGSDGAIALSLNGGSGAVVIAWENGSSAAQLNALSAGAYALELTDENGCLVRDTFAVLQPLQPLAVAAEIIVPACGLDGGSIALDAIGGTAPYNYTWSHDAALNGPLAGNLAAGIYSITIEDANQCNLNEFYTLSSPAPLVAQIDSIHHVTCFGNNNGEAFVTVTGGTAPYQYNWGTGLQTALAPFAAGTYSMEIRDAGGCQAILNFSISQPDELLANLSSEDVSCFGSNDGRAIASVVGGTQPYAYTWSNGANQITNENLTAGNYSLTVNDANGCSINASAAISEPAALAIEMLSENPGCNSNNSGSVSAMVSGGVEGYAYIWNTGSSANEISGLSSGTYEVQVTDANACIAQAEVTLVSGAAFSVFIDGDTSICIGEQTVLMATTNLSHTNYSISWGHGVNTESVAVNPAADELFTVVFTDSLGCSASATAMVHVNAIPAIGISATVSEGCAPLCTKLEAPDGASSYNWSFTDGRVAQGQDPTLCFDNAGIYGVALSVIDSNGCSAQLTWTETIEVHAVPVAAFTANPTDITLDDPSVSFSSQSTGADSYMYFFGDPSNNYVTTSTAQHAYSDTGSFEVTLLVTNEYGCKDDAVRTIHVGGFTAFYIPNAFSPDGDGTNDVFMPKASGLAANGYEMQIFDRWGNLIFVTNDWDKGWDGTYMGNPVPSEQYVCKVRYYDGKGRANAQISSVVIAE